MPQIPAAIPTQAFELIRNRIAEILVDELPSQATFAGDPKLNATVYVERSVMFDLTDLPAVNVSVSRTAYSEQTQRNTDGEHTFTIDVHTSAKSTSSVRGDSLAAFRLQKLLGVCRGILEDSRYKTLGFAPPFIESRKVTAIEYAQPTDGDGTSSVQGRITFVVRAPDRNGVVTPELIAGYDTQVKLGLTEKGYIFTGDNIPVPPIVGAEISVNGTFYIEAEAGDEVDIPVLNSEGDAVGTVTPSVGVEVPDATYTLIDTDVPPNTLDSGSIASGAAATIVAPAATVTVNTTPFGTAPSGGTFDVVVVNGGSNPVGSEQSGEWVIGNSTVTINGTQVGDIEAEDSLPIAVRLDGNPSGVWNAGTQTWEVTSAPCADGLLGINGNAGLVSVPSGGTANVEVQQGGVNVGIWDGTRWIVPPCAPATFSIDGTQVDTIASGADLDVTLLLDGVAPPSYTYNPGTDTLNVISPPPSTGWVRPSDWIAIPDLTAADERGYFLVVVFENGYNQLGLAINNLAANINWGDGTSVVSNGSTQTKLYNYSTLAGPVSVWPDGRNYKQVLVDVTRVGGPITLMNWTSPTTINSLGNNNVVDAIFSFPSLTTCQLSLTPLSGARAMPLLERLRVRNTGAVTSWRMTGINGLQALEWADFEGTIPNDLLIDCQVIELTSLNISAVNAFGMLRTSRIRKVGAITANTGATGSRNVLADCLVLEEVGTITMTSATILQSFFGITTGCPMLTKVGLITADNNQSLNSFALRCYSLEELIFNSCALVTDTTNMVFQCVSLVNLVTPGLTRGVNLSSTAMGLTGMSNFANSLGIASGAQTVTVTGTPYGALLTALDATALAIRLVMTGKGYTVAN